MKRPHRAAIARAVLLGLVLGVHLETRLWTHLDTPPDLKHFWPSSYLVSLSLMSGHGFSYLLPADASTRTSVLIQVNEPRHRPGPAGPVMDFLSGSGRQELSQEELADYVSSGVKSIPIDLAGSGLVQSQWETTRILDIRLAAILWRLFGVRWSVLFAFYSVVSTLTAFFVFLIVRRLTRSYWGGLLGAVGFMASPLERIAGAWSIRDTNPLWFTALAIYLLFRFAVEPGPSRARTYLGWYAVGAGSALGLGWRSDAQLLPPFIVLGLVTILATRGVGLRRIVLAAALCIAGTVSLRAVIDWLGPGSSGQGGNVVFHIAWHGEHIRSDLLGTENAFQIKQDDYLTLYQANYFRQQRTGKSLKARDIYEPRHFATVRSMYIEMARYSAYSWWRTFPGFLWQGTHVDRALVPGPSGGGVPVDDEEPLGGRSTLIRLVYGYCLKPYVSWIPVLFVLGLVLGLMRTEARVPTLLLGGYFVYYSAALFMVLPESKHWPPLLLPLHVLSAAGLWWGLTAFRWWRPSPDSGWGARLRTPLLLVGLAAVAWVAAGATAHAVSRAQRRSIADSILASPELPPDGSPPLAASKLFSVTTSGESANARVGYLLRVRGARRPVDLYCVHLRDATAAGSTPLYYYTRHTLEPDREQFFFVNSVAGINIGDDRPYTLLVRVRGRAEILSVKKLDLSHWSMGLPLSFLFTQGDDEPGSDLVDNHARRPVTDEFVTRKEAEAFARPPM